MFALSISFFTSLYLNAKEAENNKIEIFSNNAIKSINNLNCFGIEKELNEKKIYFTDNGWKQYY